MILSDMGELPNISKAELVQAIKGCTPINIEISNALAIAENVHFLQLRDNGTSYLNEHIYYVAYLVVQFFHNEQNIADLIIIALLHDVMEMSDYSVEYLEQFYSSDIIEILKLLTKNQEDRSQYTQEQKYNLYSKYIKGLENNRTAVMIKLVDRLANMRCDSLHSPKVKFPKYKRMCRETEKILILLSKKYRVPQVTAALKAECTRINAFLQKQRIDSLSPENQQSGIN